MSIFSSILKKYGKDLGAFALGGLPGLVGYEKVKSIGASGKRERDYINDAHSVAQQRMKTAQAEGTQSNLESLNARGMLGAGVGPIRAALMNGSTPGATDLAGASRSTLAGEYGLDRRALETEYQKDLKDNKINTTNAYIGLGTGAVKTAAALYTGGAGVAAANAVGDIQSGGAPGAPAATPIRSALLSGGSKFGIHPTDPLGDESSAWHTPAHISINGDAMSNASFNDSGI